MRILFTTDAIDKPSTQLNAPNYAKLNELDGVRIDFYNRNYADYDVVLFMGYDARVTEARAVNPSLKIGVIDLRFIENCDARGADFAIANGIELHDWLSYHFENIFIYPIYPQIDAPPKKHEQKKPLIIGYHGNKKHLIAMRPHVTAALEALSEEYEVEIWAVYNLELLGPISFELCDPEKVKVRYFQWEEGIYEKILAQADMGIVPSLVPLKDDALAKQFAEPFSPLLPSNAAADYLLRFKKTTNAGRIYVFSQLGIPVVAGMSPSASQAIQHGVNGYLALSAAGWYHGLKKLADSDELRSRMGKRLYQDFQRDVAPNVLNRKLIEFIRQLSPTKSPPSFDDHLLKLEKPLEPTVERRSARYLVERAKNTIRRLF